MTITLRPPGGSKLLHFCVENTSAHALEVNNSELPWNTPNLLRFTILNASGNIAFAQSPIIEQPMGPPTRRTIAPWDSLEADLPFQHFAFYKAAAGEDLLVMWSGEIGLYEEGNVLGKTLPVSGITFVPRH